MENVLKLISLLKKKIKPKKIETNQKKSLTNKKKKTKH